jgi:hypothetical protein
MWGWTVAHLTHPLVSPMVTAKMTAVAAKGVGRHADASRFLLFYYLFLQEIMTTLFLLIWMLFLIIVIQNVIVVIYTKVRSR